MAGDSEMRIEALKKAYAEIILNTSKEAASRVMVAERKALCFHNDLVSLKQESLTMFMRLKENFNSKITEAEAKSCNQEMKIEELEAQLSEAEGIIVDLRDELQQVYEQLDVIRHNQKQITEAEVQPAHECILQKSAHNSSPLAVSPVSVDCDERNVAILHPTSPINKCSHASSNELSTKSDLDEFPSGKYNIISMESELHENGASERNLSNVNLSPPSEDHQPTVSAQPEAKQEDSGNNSYIETLQKESKKRGKSSDELSSESWKSRKTSSTDVSCSEAHLKTVSISVAKDPFPFFSSENVKVVPNASLVNENQTIRSLRRSSRTSSRYKEAISSLKRPYHKKCIKSSQKSSIDVKFKNSMEENENSEKYASLSDEVGTSGEKVSRVSDDTVLLDAHLFDVPITEAYDSIPSQTQNQPGKEKQLKFTFYRKRRKNVLGKHDVSAVKKEPENRSLE